MNLFSFQAMGYMGSGFSAINIGDEIIEINNQVVVRDFNLYLFDIEYYL